MTIANTHQENITFNVIDLASKDRTDVVRVLRVVADTCIPEIFKDIVRGFVEGKKLQWIRCVSPLPVNLRFRTHFGFET